MIANYHTHTSRCHHASGTEEEYIKKAIAEGLETLGFADHAPYVYPEGYVSHFKMTPDEAPDYYNTISALREKYRDKIEILIGYEAEYYPELWDATLEEWKKYPPEYLILGQHYVGKEYDPKNGMHTFAKPGGAEKLKLYVDTVIQGISTGAFTYIAHPDMVNYSGNPHVYDEEMTRLILAAKEREIPLEINLLGVAENRLYPNEPFWKLCGALSADAIIGCDAHSPSRVAVKEEITAAYRIADKYGVNLLKKIKVKNPFEKTK